MSASFQCKSDENQINFLFKYGVVLLNELNTFDYTYQKDLVLDPPVKIDLALEPSEMDSIFEQMKMIDFFNYPDSFVVNTGDSIVPYFTPSIQYYIFVQISSISKELYWDDAIWFRDTEADKLRSLFIHIIQVIQSKEIYVNLPEPRGGYN